MGNSRKSLRKAIWATGADPSPRDIGEALRDVDTAFTQLVPMSVVTSVVIGGTSFAVNADHAPVAIVVGRVTVHQSPAAVPWSAAIDWGWNGTNVVVTTIGGLTAGVKYDITLLLFG